MLSKKKAIALVLTFAFLLAGCNTAENQQAPAEQTPPPVVEQEAPKLEPEQPEAPTHNFKKGEWSPELAELMTEINAKHAAVKQETPDPAIYKREQSKDHFVYQDLRTIQYEKYVSKVLTTQEAMEDVNYLFDVYQDIYGLYNYFGGAETFEAAREAVLAECSAKETISSDELQQILLDHLDFVEDAHMTINGQLAGNFSFPFFFRETAFVKTENGYATTDGKQVAAVEGYENLEDLFKPSINKDGELVYYPILIQEGEGSGRSYAVDYDCDTTLTVQYEDGTSQILTGETYHRPKSDPDREVFSIHENNEIPVIVSDNFLDHSVGERKMKQIFSEYEDSPVLIVDMRCHGGGRETIKNEFTKALFGEVLPQNITVIDPWTEKCSIKLADKIVANDKLVIILTDKTGASMCEWFLDSAYNMENVLIIGENTYGCLRGSLGVQPQLPNSGHYVAMSKAMAVHFPEGMPFKEFEGFRPDIWVPSGEAEETAVAFVNNMMK